MKKNHLWAICNLVASLVIILCFVFALTYEVKAFEEYADKMEAQGKEFSGLAVLGLVACVIYAGMFAVVSLVLLTVSYIGLFASSKTGFLVVGVVGKFIMLGGFFFFFLGSISVFGKALFIFLILAYIASGILDIVFRKKLNT